MPVSAPVPTPIAKPYETTYNKPAQREIPESNSVGRSDTIPITPLVMPAETLDQPSEETSQLDTTPIPKTQYTPPNSTSQSKEALALRRLRSHNRAGLNES